MTKTAVATAEPDDRRLLLQRLANMLAALKPRGRAGA